MQNNFSFTLFAHLPFQFLVHTILYKPLGHDSTKRLGILGNILPWKYGKQFPVKHHMMCICHCSSPMVTDDNRYLVEEEEELEEEPFVCTPITPRAKSRQAQATTLYDTASHTPMLSPPRKRPYESAIATPTPVKAELSRLQEKLQGRWVGVWIKWC